MSSSSESITLSGSVERVTFHREDTGFAVFKMLVDRPKREQLVAVVGKVPAIHSGEEVTVTGHWENRGDYGRQFVAQSVNSTHPSSAAGMERYLASGLIDGIGPAYAKRIVRKFGERVFEVLDHSSRRLEAVEGIGPKRRREIKCSWEKQKIVRSIMLFLHQHGISTARAVRIYKTYSDKSIEVLENDPYQLARDIHGIGFKTADQIASRLGMEPGDPKRLKAGLHHALFTATNAGHAALPEMDLVRDTAEMLQRPPEALRPVLEKELKNGDLVVGHELIYLPHLRRAEQEIAEGIRNLADSPATHPSINADKAIAWVEKRIGYPLADEQKQAVKTALNKRAVIITGGPGVGKTTVINSILAILGAKGVEPVLCAPTGRAAKRLSESTGMSAGTIHRTLNWQPPNGFAHHPGNPLKGDLLVVDEASMIDLTLMRHLLRGVPKTMHLLVVGDADQLPSVGPGNVLRDLIESDVVPVVRLNRIFRQGAESAITTTAHAMRNGKLPSGFFEPTGASSDLYWIERTEPEDLIRALKTMVCRRIPQRFQADPLKDVQVLAPMNRGSIGCNALNKALQEWLNPPQEFKPELERFGVIYRRGDKIIQTCNNYERDVFNGDIGVIVDIGGDPLQIEVRFEDGRLVSYASGDLDELRLAYALTVHKAQGSEFPVAVLVVAMPHYPMLQRNLIYTGLTRARRGAVILGDRKALEIAVKRHDTGNRCGALNHWLAE